MTGTYPCHFHHMVPALTLRAAMSLWNSVSQCLESAAKILWSVRVEPNWRGSVSEEGRVTYITSHSQLHPY